MGGIGGLVGGSGGGKGGGGGGMGGASDFDLSAIANAVGINKEMITNRYNQLGLGVPSGDPAQAAKAGTSLTKAGPGSAENADLSNQDLVQNALIGQVQESNIGNAAAPGSPTNIGAMANQGASSAFGLAHAGLGALGK